MRWSVSAGSARLMRTDSPESPAWGRRPPCTGRCPSRPAAARSSSGWGRCPLRRWPAEDHIRDDTSLNPAKNAPLISTDFNRSGVHLGSVCEIVRIKCKAVTVCFYARLGFYWKQGHALDSSLYEESSAHHAFEDGYLPVVWNHVVTRCVLAVQHCLFGLRPPDVRRPPDSGQQSRGATHWIIAGPGGLLVPGFDLIAGDEQRHGDAHQGKLDWPLHVRIRIGTCFFTQRGAERVSSATRWSPVLLRVGKTFCRLYRPTVRRYCDPRSSSNQNLGGWMILCACDIVCEGAANV